MTDGYRQLWPSGAPHRFGIGPFPHKHSPFIATMQGTDCVAEKCICDATRIRRDDGQWGEWK